MKLDIKKLGSYIRNFLIQYKIISIFILLCIILAFTSPVFLTQRNLINIIRQVSITAIVAAGFTLTLASGSIDLSVGSVLAVSALICANMMKSGIPVAVSILAALLAGGMMGLITGTITNYFKLSPFISTLATMQVYRGISWLYSGGVQIFEFDESFTKLGTGYWGIIPIPVIIMLAVAVITTIILNKTKLGRNICAIGGNSIAARVSGINIEKTSNLAFLYTGILAGLAGVITTARLDMARPDAGNGIEMDVIAAVVIGGTSLNGGKGTVLGTIIGCLLVGTINNGLTINGVNPYVTIVCKGLLILVAVIIDSKVSIAFTKKRKEN